MNLLLQEAINKATPIRSGLLQQATPAPMVTPVPKPAQTPVAPTTPSTNVPRSIDAASVITPPVVPEPFVPKQTPLQTFDSAAQVGQDGVVRLQNEYTKQMDDMRDTISDFQVGTQDTYQNTFDELAKQQGYDDGKTLMSRLSDESAKLAQIQGKYRTREYDITTSPETRAVQGGLLTEMNRRSQIEIGNQALLVQALQGSYNTARQTAMDVANLAYQDKREEIDALKWQYDQIAGIVEGEQKQVLEERRRLLDQEESALEDSKTWIQTAIQSGGASADELYRLTSPEVSNEDKAILAQQVVARTSGQDRAMDMQERYADMSGGGVNNDLFFELGQTEKRSLIGAGFTSDEIEDMEVAVNQLGLEGAIAQGGYVDTEANAIRQAFKQDVQETITREDLRGTYSSKQIKNIIKAIEGDDLFGGLVKDYNVKAGGFLTLGIGEKGIENFYDALEEKLIPYWQERGKTRREILDVFDEIAS